MDQGIGSNNCQCACIQEYQEHTKLQFFAIIIPQQEIVTSNSITTY